MPIRVEQDTHLQEELFFFLFFFNNFEAFIKSLAFIKGEHGVRLQTSLKFLRDLSYSFNTFLITDSIVVLSFESLLDLNKTSTLNLLRYFKYFLLSVEMTILLNIFEFNAVLME